MSTSTWPVPDREIQLAGRRYPLEIVLVAGLYAAAALWLAVQLWGSVVFYVGLLRDIFAGSEGAFLYAWSGYSLIAVFWWLAITFSVVALLLLRLDPVGRGLSAVVTGLMAVSTFASQPTWPIWLILLATSVGTAILYLSPWARRAFAASPVRRGRPEPVVLAEGVAVSFYTVLGAVSFLLLPAGRLLGEFGARFALFEALTISAAVSVWVARRQLRSGEQADRRIGRLLLTITSGMVVVGYLVATGGSAAAIGFAVFAATVTPPWLAPSARAYFGDQPLQQA